MRSTRYQAGSLVLVLLLSVWVAVCVAITESRPAAFLRPLWMRRTGDNTHAAQRRRHRDSERSWRSPFFGRSQTLLRVTAKNSTTTTEQELQRETKDAHGVAVDRLGHVDSVVASKFKVLTCCSTACSAKRKAHSMDEYATFGAFYGRIHNSAPSVGVEEAPCLGACEHAPCVAIEHDDYDGPVALLDGMTTSEFSDRVFHRIVTEQDVDRVWSSLETAILAMAEEEEHGGGESGDGSDEPPCADDDR